MILVTGATGNLGKATVEFLAKKIPAKEIAVLVRDANKASDLKALGVDVRVGDYHDKDSLVKAFQGVEKVLLISSNDFNDRLGQQKRAVNAAKEAGVKHILYTGVSMQNIEQSALKPFMGDHFDTEKHILESGLTYTFLRDNLYADVLPMFVGEHVLETGINFPAGNGRVPYTLRTEMAEAFANVLSTAGHENKTYEISNVESYSYQDVADALSAHSGKTVNYTDVSVADFSKTLSEVGLPEAMIGFSVGFATATKDGDFDIPNTHLEQLLGRKPSSLNQFIGKIFQ
ncbi:SDR family oxidoreductase [Fluviicola taffensis]|uniref:NmrA family protein n=1 Tax=Fluviicola taffensis (strain DSM 16823 / NCIMB 13979 / RW262) TaxID=755732 RepID=F2IH58_FLUTR|nr:SDR family oxidoreductase [Fluviicola taffensis]AEA45872.1 NmrA family protein [Fluviicola taffensis DSM 16823]